MQLEVSGYAIDSRKIKEGNLFFALEGSRSQGVDFLEEVALRGAKAAVVPKEYQGESFGLELIRVNHVLKTLHSYAKESLELFEGVVVGITGSVGKTTVKEFTFQLIEESYRVSKSEANYNTKRTLPLAVLNRRADAEILLLEMGISEPGDMEELVSFLPVQVAMVTSVELAHVSALKNLETIAREKSQIFQSPKMRCALFHESCTRFSSFKLSRGFECISFSGEMGSFEESHLRENVKAAFCLASALGVDKAALLERVERLTLPLMRFERQEKEGVLWINDAYNANPVSVKAALRGLPKGRRRVAVLGAMLELGDHSIKEHRQVGEMAKEWVDCLFVFGREAKPLYEEFCLSGKRAFFFEEKEALKRSLKEEIKVGDVVLVKGSRSMKMEECL